MRTALDCITVRLTRHGRFDHDPDAMLSVPANAEFDITDVDGDGRDDILVQWLRRHDEDTPFPAEAHSEDAARRVYFSRGATP